MKPSTKILTGAALALCGYYLGNLTDSYRVRRNVEIKSEIEKLRSGDKSAQFSGNLPHSSTSEQTASLISGAFQGLGVMLFILGTYQNAKTTEQLVESLPKPQAPTHAP